MRYRLAALAMVLVACSGDPGPPLPTAPAPTVAAPATPAPATPAPAASPPTGLSAADVLALSDDEERGAAPQPTRVAGVPIGLPTEPVFSDPAHAPTQKTPYDSTPDGRRVLGAYMAAAMGASDEQVAAAAELAAKQEPQPDALSAAALCSGLMMTCVSVGKVDAACVDGLAVCATDEPWRLEEAPCCHRSCAPNYRQRVADGEDPGGALMTALFGARGVPGCMPGLPVRQGR